MNKGEFLLSDECLRERTEDLQIARQAHAVAVMNLDSAAAELARVRQREHGIHAEMVAAESAVAQAENAAVAAVFDDDPRTAKHARAEYRSALDERQLLARTLDFAILRRRAAERNILETEMSEQAASADLVKAEAELREIHKLRSLLPILEAEGSIAVTGGLTSELFAEVGKIRLRASAYLERLDQHDRETAVIKASLR